MSLTVFYECVDCGQELFHCDTCKAYFHVTEMGFVSQPQSFCTGCMQEALQKAPVRVTVHKQPMNLARLRLVRKA